GRPPPAASRGRSSPPPRDGAPRRGAARGLRLHHRARGSLGRGARRAHLPGCPPATRAPAGGTPRPLARDAGSQADPLREALPLPRRSAEERRARPGPPEVEVGIVLPGEAEAAVELDALRGAVEERFCAA